MVGLKYEGSVLLKEDIVFFDREIEKLFCEKRDFSVLLVRERNRKTYCFVLFFSGMVFGNWVLFFLSDSKSKLMIWSCAVWK